MSIYVDAMYECELVKILVQYICLVFEYIYSINLIIYR